MRYVVEKLLPCDGRDGHGSVFPWSHPQEADGDKHFRIFWIQLVTGQLFSDESIVRLVAVEAANDIVAIPPRIRPFDIVRETAGIGVTDHIEPMPRLLLAVMRATQ